MTFQEILKDTLERWWEGLIDADAAMHLIHDALIEEEEK